MAAILKQGDTSAQNPLRSRFHSNMVRVTNPGNALARERSDGTLCTGCRCRCAAAQGLFLVQGNKASTNTHRKAGKLHMPIKAVHIPEYHMPCSHLQRMDI